MRAFYGSRLSEHMIRTPEGYLVCKDVPIARTGSQQYRGCEFGGSDPDKIYRVERPEDEVFAKKALASFEGKPVLDEHPDEDINAQNITRYIKGTARNVHRGEGELAGCVVADLIVYDGDLIREIENGKRDGGAGGNLNGKRLANPTKNTNHIGQAAENGYNEHREVTAKGRHPFPEVLFVSKQKFKNHLRDHADDLLKAGIRTEAEYRRETRRVIESPVGGDILGHIANKKHNQIVRYDKRINLFVKGNPDRGVFTSFVPDGEPGLYYEIRKKGDLEHDGEE